MASIILYSTFKPKGSDYQPVQVGKRVVFIRAETHRGGVLRALEMADPREGEIVLNSIPAG